MNVRQWCVKYLVTSGLHDTDAENIISDMESVRDPGDVPLLEVFYRSAEGYPRQFFAAIIFRLNQLALAWIDINAPMHFARLMFVT